MTPCTRQVARLRPCPSAVVAGLLALGPRRRLRQERRRDPRHHDPGQGLGHHGQRRPGVGRGVPEGRARPSTSRCPAAAPASASRPSSKGTIDIANASRNMKPEEIEQARKNTGKEPQGVHRRLRRARRLRPQGQPARRDHHRAARRDLRRGRQRDQVVRARRHDPRRERRHHRAGEPAVELRAPTSSSASTSSGTKDFKLGSRDMNGSKEVVELVGNTPTAIGYSGMGYVDAVRQDAQARPPSRASRPSRRASRTP